MAGDRVLYMGREPDRGRIVVGKAYPGEGYAVLRCGNTEVQLGYTLLHHLAGALRIDPDARLWRELQDFVAALHSITAEASIGRNGDARPPGAPNPGTGGISTDPSAGCGCQRCTGERWEADRVARAPDSIGMPRGFRFACELCGCKRCPHHAWHGFRCTDSNAVGQVGVPIEP